ncbi:MAG: amino acid carrier protein [Ruminococcus sp.]|nr:amino acid carrier protein [Ruminococcus sp.]
MIEKINAFIWGGGLVFLLLATGLAYTIKLGFIQFGMFPYIIKNSRNRAENKGLSQFRTVCLSLGTSMGTGNIAGVATAIATGGAGAVFWMWVSAFLGMALVYAENSLSVIYSDGKTRGTMAYLEKGLNSRRLAVMFAIFCVLASLGMGGMVQINTFSESLVSCIDIKKYVLAPAVCLIIYLVISGGAERIGKTAQALLPVVSLLYIIGCLAVIIKFRENIPRAFSEIFHEAFGAEQAFGGISGYAVSVGIRRGIFSNEAGLGSSAILHSSAKSDNQKLQGNWSMFEVFFDTIFCCTLTAVTLLCVRGDFSVESAFSSVMGKYSLPFLAFATAVFAFCTVIGWYYCGATAFGYLSGEHFGGVFCVIFAVVASLGAVFKMKTVWAVSDIFNGLMAIPNLTGLILLMNKVRKNSDNKK